MPSSASEPSSTTSAGSVGNWRPELDPDTGLPREFMRLRPPDHVALWTDGVRRARLYGSYPALLVSLHAETIYSRHFDFDAASPDDRRIVRSFLDDQRAFRHGVTAALHADKRLAAVTTEDVLEHNRLLVAALDWMSLQICWGVTQEARLPEVPVAGEERVELTLRPGTRDGGDRRGRSLALRGGSTRGPGGGPVAQGSVCQRRGPAFGAQARRSEAGHDDASAASPSRRRDRTGWDHAKDASRRAASIAPVR